MSAAEALKAARAAGVSLRVDGGDLVLEAFAPPPSAVLDLLSRHKAELVALLRSSDGQALEACIVEWLDDHPDASKPGWCAWCGEAEAPWRAVALHRASLVRPERVSSSP